MLTGGGLGRAAACGAVPLLEPGRSKPEKPPPQLATAIATIGESKALNAVRNGSMSSLWVIAWLE
jgi:hypothetical protein